MKSGSSSLNPNAASYIPLSKRVVDTKSGTLREASNISKSFIKPAQGYDGRNTWLRSNSYVVEDFPTTAKSTQLSHQSQGSSSKNLAWTDKLIADEAYDIDLEYLLMEFPGLSHQSLTDVYLANRGDVEASIDMLNDLEFNPYDIPGNLPDTLDIGDVVETIPSTEQGMLKLKHVAGEGADASTSARHPPSLK